MSFDAERLISEIESRKAMWNISREDYTNQEIKKKQRKKIVNVFVTEKTSAEEKKDFGKQTFLIISAIIDTPIINA